MPISFGTTRGFTMHEHLDEFKLINMNGRVYDPLVGRFISPDPFVQMPDYSQSYNRYSYAFNNPLRFSDPSGFFAEGDSTLSPAQIPPPMPYPPGTKLKRSSTSTNTDNSSLGQPFKGTETTLPTPYPQSKLSNDAEGNMESQTGMGEGLSTNFVAGTSWAGFVAGAKKGYNIISNEVIRQGNYNNSIRKSGISLDDVTSLKVPNSLKIVGKYGGLIFTFYGAYNIDQQWRNNEISTGIMMIEQISNGIGAIPAYGTGWSIGWNLGKYYGPSTWYGKNNYKWFE
jgi:RHS repeat-associated protein